MVTSPKESSVVCSEHFCGSVTPESLIASSADYKVPDNVTQHGDTAVVRIEMEAIRALPDEEISATSDIIGADWRPRAHRATVHIPGMCGTHQE